MATDFLGLVMQAALDVCSPAMVPAVGRVVLSPGGEVAWDQCDCGGQLWCRVISLDPAGRGDNSGRTGPAGCAPLFWRASLGVGVIRCAATMDDEGNPPSIAQMRADTLTITSDAYNLSAVIVNDLAPQCEQLTIGRWTPLGPQGGCAGGEWQFSVLLPVC